MYGLLGKSLKHSFSKTIHETIHPMDYNLYETDNLDTFFKNTQFKGLNITIPYKKAVLPYCDFLDSSVKKTGVCNTILDKDGFKFAYNTDYLALKMIITSHFPNTQESIAIIGNGATADSFKQALIACHYDDITTYARHPNTNEKPLNDVLLTHTILINTTPVGMYPNNDESLPLNLKNHTKLKLVFDVIYNPLKTNLILEAQKYNIPSINGLTLLISQAILSSEYFFNTKYNPQLTEEIYKKHLLNTLNIAFIGLPFSGKTTYSKIMGNRLNKTFIDIDNTIEIEEKTTIETLFKTKGEPYFRTREAVLTKTHATHHNQMLSLGGGIIENDPAIHFLKQNSLLIYLDLQEKLMQTIKFHSRPNVTSLSDLLTLKKRRHKLYMQCADVMIKKDTLNHNEMIKRIEVTIHDYINHQWTQSKPTWNT